MVRDWPQDDGERHSCAKTIEGWRKSGGRRQAVLMAFGGLVDAGATDDVAVPALPMIIWRRMSKHRERIRRSISHGRTA